MSDDPVIAVIAKTRQWIENVVIGLGLCPFAEASIAKRGLRISHTPAQNEQDLATAIAEELRVLQLEENRALDGSLVIHPNVLTNFASYNQFLDRCDDILSEMNLVGEFQVASFHPRYRFAGTSDDDPGNYTNRSPYPMLHLLRESSVERATSSHPDPGAIPARNIERLDQLGLEVLRAFLE